MQNLDEECDSGSNKNIDRFPIRRRRLMQTTGVAAATGYVGKAIGERTASSEILVADIAESSYWERLTFTCLQGLANRTTSCVYLTGGKKGGAPWFDQFDFLPPENNVFLDWYKGYDNLSFRNVGDPYKLFEELSTAHFDGYVVLDRNAPVTVNVAANYASIEDLLPVTEEILSRSAVPDADVVHDLRGTFDPGDGSNPVQFSEMSKLEIYEWAMDHQWPDADHACVAELSTPQVEPPDAPALDISSYTADSDIIYLKFEDNSPLDGWGAQLRQLQVLDGPDTLVDFHPTTDAEQQYLYEESGTHTDSNGTKRWAPEKAYWIYRIDNVNGADGLALELWNEYDVSIATAADGPYDNLVHGGHRREGRTFGIRSTPDITIYTSHGIRDYTVAERGFFFELSSNPSHNEERALKSQLLGEMSSFGYVLGWHVDRDSEGDHIRHLSEYGQLALGGTTYASNFSHHSRVELPGNPVKRFKRHASRTRTIDSVDDSIYLTFVMSDGDSLNHIVRHAHGGQWLFPERGEIPFGWEIQPALADIAPGILDYFQATATDEDYFVASASGLGYSYPSYMPDDTFDDLLDATKPYLRETGMSSLTVLNDYETVPDGKKATYANKLGNDLTGIIKGYTRSPGETRLYDNAATQARSDRSRGRFPVRSNGATAWMPTVLPEDHEDPVGELVNQLETLASRRSQRPLFVPVHIPRSYFPFSEMVDLMTRLDSETFRAVGPDEFFTAFAHARLDTLVFKPPEGIVPDALSLVTGVTNEISTEVGSFHDNPVEATMELAIRSPLLEENLTSEAVMSFAAHETHPVVNSVSVPDVGTGSGEAAFSIGGGTTTVPVSFVQWPDNIAEPSAVSDQQTYEAEGTNHNDGSHVSDSLAVNGTAWQAVAGDDDADRGTNNHIVWYPTDDQNNPGDYVALFRMKVSDNTISERICTIDVVENIPLGTPGGPTSPEGSSRDLSGTTFDAAGEYQWFAVQFSKPMTNDSLEKTQTQYRVDYEGNATLTIDQIAVVRVES